jgi:hypothetical protein
MQFLAYELGKDMHSFCKEFNMSYVTKKSLI